MAWPESRVDSGALTKHPIKRTRTTLGYIVAVLLGDDEMREYIRREVNRQHRDVHSRDDDDVSLQRLRPGPAVVGGSVYVPRLAGRHPTGGG